MRVDTEVGDHATQNYGVDVAAAKLVNQVVALGAVHLVGSDDDGLAVVDVALVGAIEVSAGALKAFGIRQSCAVQDLHVQQLALEGARIAPRGIEVGVHQRINCQRDVSLFSSLHQLFDVADGIQLFQVVSKKLIELSIFLEEVILGVGDEDGGVSLIQGGNVVCRLGGCREHQRKSEQQGRSNFFHWRSHSYKLIIGPLSQLWRTTER